MMYQDSHPSRRQLILHLDGELSPRDAELVRAHLDGCRKCRAQAQEFQDALADVARAQREFEGPIPAAGPRALLKARLAQLSPARPDARFNWLAPPRGFAWAAAAVCLLAVGLFLWRWNPAPEAVAVVSVPNPLLTPGATILASRPAVCSQPNPNNKDVPAALRRKVFQEYGLAGADPRGYEVDYLVTPALGGADDIHNLWPHSYSATVWNARVKDALEDRLREMVCDGSLDLAEAQREIAQNWIVAYKKYFHTEEPLAEHAHPALGNDSPARP